MDNRSTLIDTSIFIDYFRKQNKQKSLLFQIAEAGYTLTTSSICYFEYSAGSKNQEFDRMLFENITVFPFDAEQAEIAASIFKHLKKQNAVIEFRDILIAACALTYDIPLATLNVKHFDRIKGLELLTTNS